MGAAGKPLRQQTVHCSIAAEAGLPTPADWFVDDRYKGPAYGVMVGHRSVTYEKYNVSGDHARIDAVLVAADGRSYGFRFGLTRQRGNRFEGFWMTDSVVPIEVVTL